MNFETDSSIVERLIAEARGGSNESRERLLTLSVPYIEHLNRSWVDMMVKNCLSSRDLTQDVLMLANFSFDKFRGDRADSWFAWLKTIHRRLIADLLDRKDAMALANVRSDEGDSNDLMKNLESHEMTPGTLAILSEQAERVKFVLSRMDSMLRDMLLNWLDKMTLENQAKLIGLTNHKVRLLRYKALREFMCKWKNLRESV